MSAVSELIQRLAGERIEITRLLQRLVQVISGCSITRLTILVVPHAVPTVRISAVELLSCRIIQALIWHDSGHIFANRSI